MCGIVGVISKNEINIDLDVLLKQESFIGI
jgi:hypothetical protein